MTAPFLIIGGGIAGLSTALALARIGRRSVVIEQAPEFREVGAGIQLGPNGFRALARLGLDERAASLAVFPDDLIFMDSLRATEITRIPVGSAFRERFSYPYALIHRADLHRLLVDACSASEWVEFQTATKILSFQDEGTGVTAFADDGRRLCGRALVGADGLWSGTRQSIVADGPPLVSGHIAYRAVLPTEDVPSAYRKNAMILWGGPKHHLVQYPLRGGKLFNLVAVFHSDAYVEGWDTTGDPAALNERFEGSCRPVQDLLGKIESWRMWVLCDREPVRQWSRGCATLVGDAAHPMLQYLAQGAGMAMEDAVALADEIEASDGEVERAFGNYPEQRYLRTGRCQIMARVHGQFYHAQGVAAELRNAMLAQRTDDQSYEGLAWLYDAEPQRPSHS